MIPDWIIQYDKANYQSSAGKAVRELITLLHASQEEVERLREALIAVRRHGLIEKDGYETVVNLVGSALTPTSKEK
jgi:hypothetical protein